MPTIQQLREEREAAAERLKALHDKCKEDKRDLTDAERKQWHEDDEAFERLSGEIKERNAKLGYSQDGGRRTPANCGTPLPGSAGIDHNYYHQSGTERKMSNLSQRLHGGSAGRKYADVFAKTSDGGFESLNEYMGTLFGGPSHPKYKQLQMEGGQGSKGGVYVPTMFAAEMLDASLEDEIVRPRATIRPMDTDELEIATFENQDHSSSTTYGGMSASWIGEGATATEVTGTTRKLKLKAKKLAIFSSASSELLSDSPAFGQEYEEAMTKAAGWNLDDAFLNGTGSGQPLGALIDPAVVSVAKEVGQAAATIVHENLTKMLARLYGPSQDNAVWVCSRTAIPQLLGLTIDVGTGGSHIPVLKGNGLQFTMLTRPVIFTEKVPALGTVGDISLVDFSHYVIGMRSDISLETTNAISWHEDEIDFRAILRADGRGKWREAFTPKNGDTQSWCVTLATRA